MSTGRTLTAFLLGAALLVGTVAASAAGMAPQDNGRPGPDKMIQRMAEDFGISKDDARKYMNPGVNPHELMHAALLSKASGKPFGAILAMKTLANTWQDVEESLGVSHEKMDEIRQDMMATRLAQDAAIPKAEIANLLQQQYRPRDIVMAGTLAKKTDKSTAEVLALKKINNQWPDVAKELGLSSGDFKKVMDELGKKMPCPPRHGHGPVPGGMEMMRGGEPCPPPAE